MPDDSLSVGISADIFASLIDRFAPLSSAVAVAVSGGADSMALALCMRRWNARPCVALIVDHGLRPESATEAALVKNRLAELGLNAEILRWQHHAVTGRIHEKARRARYDLLTDACRRHGCGDLLLAHHRDDQAETILMRIAKGSGSDGLAGMADQSVRDGIRMLRPFLPVSKHRLIATCAVAGVAFVTDPSNDADIYARGRLRAVMPLLRAEGLTTDSLIALGARAAQDAAALDHYARDFLRQHAHTGIGGSVHIDRAALNRLPRATAARAVSLSLRHITFADYPPDRAAVAALLDNIAAPSFAATRSLSGCLVSAGSRHIIAMREPAAARDVRPVTGGDTVLWDRRWLVTVPHDIPPDATLRALGTPPRQTIDALSPGLRRRIDQGRIRASLPALWRGQTLLAIPAFDSAASFRLSYRQPAFP